MLSISERILIASKSQLCQQATGELFHKETGKQQKNNKSAFGS